MKVEELLKFGFPEKVIEKLKKEKIKELYPPQADMVRKNLLQDRNLVITLPTAGGKTLMAALTMHKKLSQTKSKIVYIVPLVALAYEKYNYFKDFFGDEYKIAISVGDYDSSDPWLANYDIIVATSEKLDSLLRHNVSWAQQIGLAIADEVHLLNDSGRGPTLEILLTKLREVAPRSHILALSATVKNAEELAKWLNATIVISDFRPVKLYEGVFHDSKIQFYGKKSYNLSDIESEDAILQNTLGMNKQCLFFVSSRKNSETLAEQLTKTCKPFLKKNEELDLAKLSEEVLNVLEIPTHQCKKLSDCIRRGVAFHHAGLLGKQKQLIEENFRRGLLKAIVSTPTLALGVNLPAFRVIIRDAKRFYPGVGAVYIPVLEYKQMIGRAGRPQYDEFGESILVAKNEDDAHDLTEKFILGEPEEIHSKLAVEPILRMHTLALIASEFVKTEKNLHEFFGKTFYAFQYGSEAALEEKLEEVLNKLIEWRFVVSSDKKLRATKIGKRVSELYIDPLTAFQFLQSLEISKERKLSSFSFLQTISNTPEMQPLLSVRAGEFSELESFIAQNENIFLERIPEEWDLEFEDFFKSVKTAMMFEDWLNEKTEEEIFVKYKVAPGELFNRRKNADWLLYSLHELALLTDNKKSLTEVRKTRVRMTYGIREELLPLVKLEQIGRVRARKLWNANTKSLEDLRKIPIESLSRIVGSNVATIIKKQLEGQKIEKLEQSSLGEF